MSTKQNPPPLQLQQHDETTTTSYSLSPITTSATAHDCVLYWFYYLTAHSEIHPSIQLCSLCCCCRLCCFSFCVYLPLLCMALLFDACNSLHQVNGRELVASSRRTLPTARVPPSSELWTTPSETVMLRELSERSSTTLDVVPLLPRWSSVIHTASSKSPRLSLPPRVFTLANLSTAARRVCVHTSPLAFSVIHT
jgi:hypothetical protein